jgi:DNA-binding CsgD family transcriptional regulator
VLTVKQSELFPDTLIAGNSAANPVASLTRREHQVLALAAQELKLAAIGEALGISPWTVNEYLRRARVKLGVHTTLRACVLVVRSCDVTR